jgi:putative membrane protein
MKARYVIIGAVVGLALLLVIGLLAGGSLWGRSYYHHGPGMMWGDGFDGGMHSFDGGVVMILFWGLLLAAIVGGGLLLFGGVTRRARGPGEEDRETPLEILKRRYARGEIDRDEYDRIKETLYG